MLKRLSRVVVLVAAIAASIAASIPASAAEPAGVERVAWLQGCWIMTSGDRTVEEHWMAPRGGTMLGSGRTVRAGRLVEYELVLLREQGAQLAYEAHPSGQAPATFLSRTIADHEVVFENRAHDFPQRVGYRWDGRDGLLAWIEGTLEGKLQRVEFPYRRVGCAEP